MNVPVSVGNSGFHVRGDLARTVHFIKPPADIKRLSEASYVFNRRQTARISVSHHAPRLVAMELSAR
jgi:hypothetical protein